MLEILLLVYLCKRLGVMLRGKGRSPGWWQFLLVVCWFGGELVGALTMVFIVAEPGTGFDATAYLGALLGAAGGTTFVFVLANHLAPANGYQRHVSAFPVVQTSQGGSAPPPPI